MNREVPSCAIDTNYWDVLMLTWFKYQEIIDDEYYYIDAVLNGQNDRYKPLFNFCGGHMIGSFKYLPAYYKMGVSLKRMKSELCESIEDDDIDDEDDEDVRDFTPGDRELHR